MAGFTPDRSLLNPKFEGYKLDPIPQDEVISRYNLSYKPTQIAPSGGIPLSFQEVQSRIRHNHLVIAQDGRAVYVDSELKVVAVDIDETTLAPSFQVLYELPQPIQSSASYSVHIEYPSAVYLDAATLLVSDGCGSLYTLRVANEGPAQLLNSFELPIPSEYGSSQSSVPFRVHSAVHSSPEACLVLLSAKCYHIDPPASNMTAAQKAAKRSVQFDIWAAKVDLAQMPQDQPLPLEIAWHRRGDDVPVYNAYDSSRKAFLLLGTSPYRILNEPVAPSYEPAADEIAPIPRAGEKLDEPSKGAGPTLPKPPPYSWTQTSDSVTVAFPLPSTTPKTAIKVAFSPRTLTLLVQGESIDSPVPLPRYSLRTLWDEIQPGNSVWTWDRHAEQSYGLLTLHLEKQHEGTRWPQVFASSGAETEATQGGAANGEQDTDVDVPETLDPSELWQIREALEKYTAALQSGEDRSGVGLGRGIPSLAEGEIDEEVDSSSGNDVCLTWIGADGSVPPWSRPGRDDTPFNLLSTPLPSTHEMQPSLVIKHALDGVLFELQKAGESAAPAQSPSWKHTFTYPALSFVLASKRDTRFIHHVSTKAVLAFESGARDLGGNVYIYRGTLHTRDKWAKQAILRVGAGTGGSLLGVAMMQRAGKPVVLCLCEGELIVMHDIGL